jgi:hypothetical protein
LNSRPSAEYATGSTLGRRAPSASHAASGAGDDLAFAVRLLLRAIVDLRVLMRILSPYPCEVAGSSFIGQAYQAPTIQERRQVRVLAFAHSCVVNCGDGAL